MSTPTKDEAPRKELQDCKVFIVDDEDILAWSIETELRSHGADVMRAGSLRQALERFPAFSADVVITDLRLPDGNGIELLKKWKKDFPHLPIILMTAHGAVDSAIAALRLGAFDYLQKPFDLHDLVASLKRAAEVAQLRRKINQMEGREQPRETLNIIGDSAPMQALKEQLKRIARSKVDTVLVLGESGAGKELVARAVHEWSGHAGGPFVEINCASIPETLLESELFGYERGAFTDARDKKLGLFEIAKKGTVFLDEIGEMPFKLQAKLLRALESRRFKRLGGVKDIEFSARVVAATNRNLLEEVQHGNFRADLYYRLNVLGIPIPPLRDRMGDLEDLTLFFLGKLSAQLEIKLTTLSPGALLALKEHYWPGNVRELRNVLLRALVLHEPDILGAEHLTFDTVSADPMTQRPASDDRNDPRPPQRTSYEGTQLPAKGPPHHTGESTPSEPGGLPTTGSIFHLPEAGLSLEDLEKSLLEQALLRSRHNQTRAAQLLGISRHTLRYRLEKHGLLAQDL